MVKKLSMLLCAAVLISSTILAQETKTLTIKAGTPVQITSENGIRAAKVKAGETVEFRVTTPVNVDGITAIPYNSLVRGTVTKAKRSAIGGVKGKLQITVNDILLPTGETVPLTNKQLNFDGNSRVAWVLPVGLLLFWPILFIPGQRAEVDAGYSTTVTVAVDTDINIK